MNKEVEYNVNQEAKEEVYEADAESTPILKVKNYAVDVFYHISLTDTRIGEGDEGLNSYEVLVTTLINLVYQINIIAGKNMEKIKNLADEKYVRNIENIHVKDWANDIINKRMHYKNKKDECKWNYKQYLEKNFRKILLDNQVFRYQKTDKGRFGF